MGSNDAQCLCGWRQNGLLPVLWRRNSTMGRKDPVRELNEALITGSIDRRSFLKRAAALGMVAAGAGAALGGEVGTVAATNAAFAPE